MSIIKYSPCKPPSQKAVVRIKQDIEEVLGKLGGARNLRVLTWTSVNTCYTQQLPRAPRSHLACRAVHVPASRPGALVATLASSLGIFIKGIR